MSPLSRCLRGWEGARVSETNAECCRQIAELASALRLVGARRAAGHAHDAAEGRVEVRVGRARLRDGAER
jgi:hypothetical protein